jgi:putative effector of murein hydrolase LrgA (UPF0299 family)
MIPALTLLLMCQLAGEVIARGLGLSVPGPVIGMGLIVALFLAMPRVAEAVRPAAAVLLGNLSLLFVPAGVGIVGHLDRLGAQGVAILTAIVVSTVLAMVVGALVFVAVARLVGQQDG